MGPCVGWCGQCYANRAGRSNYKHHWGYMEPPSETEAEKDMKRRGRQAADQAMEDGVYLGFPFGSQRWPMLLERMTCSKWDDGRGRETDTLLLFFGDSGWQGVLKDRAEGYIAFVTAGSPEEILDVLEAGLQGDSLSWRADRYAKGRGKKSS